MIEVCIMLKYDRGLYHAMRHDLHWLDMTDRTQMRTAVSVHRCLHGTAAEHLSEPLVPASTWSSRHCLRSFDSNQLIVPPVKLSTYHIYNDIHIQPPPSRRTTTSSQHARPSSILCRRFDGLECAVWRPPRIPSLSADNFRKTLKTHLFRNALGHLAH